MEPTKSALPKITKRDDTVFLTPLPIINYAKPPTKPSNPNQNLLIKALLAQKSTLSPYMVRPPGPRPALRPSPMHASRPATKTTTSFIIRASTKSPSGKTQILNLPVSVSTPISIVRNADQGPVRPTITKKLLEEIAQRPVARSAFVRVPNTTTGTEFAMRNPAFATVMTSHATTTMAITTPMTATSRVSYSPNVATTTVSISTAKPIMLTSTTAQKTCSTFFPTYTKTYIPVLPPPPRKSKAVAANKTPKPVGNRVRPACPSTCLLTGTSSPSLVTVAQRPPARALTNLVPISGYVNRGLEPGEILQVRKIPHRTFSGPRSVPAVVEEPPQQKAAKHAENHAESQATLQALQVHYGTTRDVLHATSLAALQAASHAQLEAASQERLESAKQQAKSRAASQKNLPTNSKSHFQVASLGKIQTVSLSKPQGILNVQLLTAAQSQLLATSQAQLQAMSQAQIAPSQAQLSTTSQAQHHGTSQSQLHITSQSQLHTPSQSQLHITSQSQLHITSQSQLKTTTQVQHQAISQAQLESQADSRSPAQPSARTHHRLIIRSVAPRVAVPTSHCVAEAPPTQGADATSSSIHSTTTLTLSAGTTLIMPHYKTTVFKNLSTIAHAEPSRLATPTTTAGAAEKIVIRRPVAYFSARRTFPTQPSGSSTPVNMQRHIIRTIPRHVLGSHLQLTTAKAPPVPRIPQVVPTLSPELPGSTTSSQNKSQSTDKKKYV